MDFELEEWTEMLSKLPSTLLKASPAGLEPSISHHGNKRKFGRFIRKIPERKFRFNLVGLSMGDKWNLKDIDASEFLNFNFKELQFYGFQFAMLLCLYIFLVQLFEICS